MSFEIICNSTVCSTPYSDWHTGGFSSQRASNAESISMSLHQHGELTSQISKFMGPTWGPPGSCRPQMGPMLARWTWLSGIVYNIVWYWTMYKQLCFVMIYVSHVYYQLIFPLLCHFMIHHVWQTDKHRADSRFAPSQWEKALLCNNVSRWLGPKLESALQAPV